MAKKFVLPIAILAGAKIFGSKPKGGLAKLMLVDHSGKILRELSLDSGAHVSAEGVSSMLFGKDFTVKDEFEVRGLRVRIVPGEGASAVIISEGMIPETESAIVEMMMQNLRHSLGDVAIARLEDLAKMEMQIKAERSEAEAARQAIERDRSELTNSLEQVNAREGSLSQKDALLSEKYQSIQSKLADLDRMLKEIEKQENSVALREDVLSKGKKALETMADSKREDLRLREEHATQKEARAKEELKKLDEQVVEVKKRQRDLAEREKRVKLLLKKEDEVERRELDLKDLEKRLADKEKDLKKGSKELTKEIQELAS